jgi:16S rRNA (uracil1498-N3)-methyltransferase
LRLPRVPLAAADILDAVGRLERGDGHPRPAQLVLGGGAFRHLVKVLRLGPGDRFLAVVPAGEEWQLAVHAVGRQALTAAVEGVGRPPSEARAQVTLVTAIPRAGRMDWLVEKAAELGVATIQPLWASRSVALPAEDGGRLARWERLALAAAAQSGRLRPPLIRPPCDLAAAVASCPGAWLFAQERSGTVGLAAAARGLWGRREVVWAVGPEGGWTPEEVAIAAAAGAVAVSLGPRILRVETAAVAGLAVLMSALGELGPPPEATP